MCYNVSMDHKVGYYVTGYRKYKGEVGECAVGAFTGGGLKECYRKASLEGDAWAQAQGAAFVEYHIDPIYEPEEEGYVPFEER